MWQVATLPYRGAHFATFPPKLVEPCILAGTSDRGCCPKCGAPWVGIKKKTRVATRPGRQTKSTGNSAVEGPRDPGRHVTHTETVGWKPGCGHHQQPVPCLVLDPFAGTAVTGAVALKHGRRFVGIELNPDTIKLAYERLAEHRNLFTERFIQDQPEARKGKKRCA
ncbi:MAG: hypothetical protein K8R92_00885 [Planctomycetes bacterium]|nr:hypothetical protein [Planctomycetota bacterium]